MTIDKKLGLNLGCKRGNKYYFSVVKGVTRAFFKYPVINMGKL